MEEKQKNKMLAILEPEMPTLEAIMSLSHPGEDVKTLILSELEHLKTAAMTQPAIAECVPQSIVIAVKTALRQNLSLDPAAGLTYIKTRNIKIGEKNWAKALEIQPSANGLISYNRMCGRLLDIDRPEVKKDESGKVIEVSVSMLVPSYPEPRWKTITFDESDFERWKRASHKENSRNKQDANDELMNYANPNYTSWKGGLDPEFARAKAIRHGLKKLGTNPNETLKKIVPVFEKQVVDINADISAINDEYSSHEELESVVKTTISEDKSSINIPNSNEL